MLAVMGEKAVMSRGCAHLPDASTVIQTWPLLVEEGTNVALHDASNDRHEARSAVGVSVDGRVFLATSDGALTMVELAQGLIELGALSAGYTDGGASRSMFVRGSAGGLVHSVGM